MGGYIGIPIAIASKLLGIHIIIHEQNAIPGMANKVISIFANRIFSGFENSLKKAEVIGNPIRSSISNIKKPQQRFKNKIGPLNILILGGSLGASSFNRLLPPILNNFNSKQISVIHQSGLKHYEELNRIYKNLAIDTSKENPTWLLSIEKFIFDIEEKYEWADVVIARSGALTVSEFIEAGIASILIPFPYAVDNHQYFNAKVLKNRDGAKIIMEHKIEDELEEYMLSLNRKKCLNMAEKAKARRRQEASKKIYEYISNHEK